MRNLPTKILAGLTAALFSSTCQAVVVTYDMTGHVNYVDMIPVGSLPAIVPNVSTFTGSFSYDTSLPGAYRPINRAFIYTATGPASALNITFETEGYVFASNPLGLREIYVYNDDPTLDDQFTPESLDVLGYNGDNEYLLVSLGDLDHSALPDYSLPQTLTLSDWPHTLVRVVITGFNPQPSRIQVDCTIETLTLRVPEPTCLAGVLLVSLAVGRRTVRAATERRRFRR